MTSGINYKGIQYKIVDKQYVYEFLDPIDKKYCIIKIQPGKC
jgi:hypothetical protein